MKKISVIALSIILGAFTTVAIVGFIRFNFTYGGDVIPGKNAPDVSNISYKVDGQVVLLQGGSSELKGPDDEASAERVSIFGEPVYADLDGDTDLDAVAYLTRDSGGSGTFYYVVVVVNNDGVYTGTDAMFLGDRIAPQSINIQDGRAVVNFVERKAGEPFTTQPSVGKSIWVHLDAKNLQIGEWVKDFEGEADPKRMKLSMKTWEWIHAEGANKKITKPASAGMFTLSFGDGGSFTATTDCNSASGTYANEGGFIEFGPIASTRMYCENSIESDFFTMLSSITKYYFTGKGELVFVLGDSGESMFLR